MCRGLLGKVRQEIAPQAPDANGSAGPSPLPRQRSPLPDSRSTGRGKSPDRNRDGRPHPPPPDKAALRNRRRGARSPGSDTAPGARREPAAAPLPAPSGASPATPHACHGLPLPDPARLGIPGLRTGLCSPALRTDRPAQPRTCCGSGERVGAAAAARPSHHRPVALPPPLGGKRPPLTHRKFSMKILTMEPSTKRGRVSAPRLARGPPPAPPRPRCTAAAAPAIFTAPPALRSRPPGRAPRLALIGGRQTAGR